MKLNKKILKLRSQKGARTHVPHRSEAFETSAARNGKGAWIGSIVISKISKTTRAGKASFNCIILKAFLSHKKK